MAEDEDAKPAAPAPAAEPAKSIDHQAPRPAPTASQPVEPGKAN
jgi:hypothetical protein